MTPQELKNSILQLAIQGKLVPQDASEGTGEEIYKQIRTEKNELIKDGKIKRGKPLSEITEDEIPFEIPESWKWAKLSEVIDVRDGTHDSPKYHTEGYPLVTSKNLHNNTIDFSTCKLVSKEDFESINIRSKVDDGDILFAMIGTVGNPVLYHGKADFCIKNMALFKHIGNSINMRYVYWFLMHAQDDMKKQASGGVQNFVSLGYLRNYLIPLPPFAEQKRIVTKIEELLPLVNRYEQAWSKLENFNKRFPVDMQKSILQMAIQGKLVPQDVSEGTGEELYKQIKTENIVKDGMRGKGRGKTVIAPIEDSDIPFDIPDSWKWVRLGTIGYTNIGLTYNPKNVSSDGTIVLRSGNIQDGHMDYTDIVRVDINVPDNKICQKGDILICARNGSKRLVGKAAIVDKDGMSFGAFMAIFRSVCNRYIYYVIRSAYFRNSLLGDTGTTTINQITQEMLKNVLIPLPPLAEQKRIVAKIKELMPLCDKLKEE